MIALTSSPPRDWLPVFQPATYVFQFTQDQYTDFETPDLSDDGTGKVKLNWPAGSDEPSNLPYSYWTFAGTAGDYAGLSGAVLSHHSDITTGRTMVLDIPYNGPEAAPDGVLITGHFEAPALVLKVEVSANFVDFATPINAGLAMIPADAAGQYAFNPNSYLSNMFSPLPPVTVGPDYNLYKYFRILAGAYDAFNGIEGTPAVVTTPARSLYASELTPLAAGSTSLSIEPTAPNASGYDGIKTVIASGTITNLVLSAAGAPCKDYPLNLYWINRKGGWQSFTFGGKHEYTEEIPEAATYEDYLGYNHKASIKGAKKGVNVFSGFLDSAAYDMVLTIRSAIRVYQYTGTEFREVNIKGGTFPIRKEGNRLYECNFSFTYSEPVIIQEA